MKFITLGDRQHETVLVALSTLRRILDEAGKNPEDLKEFFDVIGIEDGSQLLDVAGIGQLLENIVPGGVQCHNDEFPGFLGGYAKALENLESAVDHMQGVEDYLTSMEAAALATGEAEVDAEANKMTLTVDGTTLSDDLTEQ